MNISELTASQLRQAAAIKEQMERLQKELNSILGTPSPAPALVAAPKSQRMSPAAKARLSAKLKEIWVRRKAKKAAKVVPAPKPAGKTASAPKRKWKLSAAGLARIKAANKAYWAAKKAAKK